MFTMMDRDEVRRFATVAEVETYLGQVAASDYAEKVLKWVESAEQTLFINNGPMSQDIWVKHPLWAKHPH